MHLKAILYFTGLVVLSAFAQVATIEADINSLSTDALNLENAINAVPNTGASLAQVLSVHSSGSTLISAFQSSTTDVLAVSGPLTAVDASALDSAASALVPVLLDVSQAYLTKEPAFASLSVNVVNLIKQDIISLRSAILAFFNALISITPPPYQQDLINDRDDLDLSYTNTINAY